MQGTYKFVSFFSNEVEFIKIIEETIIQGTKAMNRNKGAKITCFDLGSLKNQ